MDNLNIVILSGGYYQCTPEWNSEPLGRDNCYKLYFIAEGSARIHFDGEWYQLNAGNVYFINGFMLEKQICDHYMNVYWLHFIPQSQLLCMYFNNLRPLYFWEKGNLLIEPIDYKKIPFLFDAPNISDNKLLEMSSLSLICYINSVILMLISDMVEKQNSHFSKLSNDIYFKLNPAIEFINNNYMQDLNLDEMAQKAFLNPIYFLRLFKKCFKMTPNRYLNMIRMNESCKILLKTDLSIREISETIGFSNQFYFSKVFKSHFRKTPLEYRNTKFSP